MGGDHMDNHWLTAGEILDLAAPSLPASMSKLAAHIEREGWRANPSLHRVRFGRGCSGMRRRP